MTVAAFKLNEPWRGTMWLGNGMTPAGETPSAGGTASANAAPANPSASDTLKARAAFGPAALDRRPILEQLHTLTLYPIVACCSRQDPLTA